MDAYLFVRTKPGMVARVASQLPTVPGIRRAVVVVGRWDVIATVEGADLEHVATTVLSRVHDVDGIERTLTVPVVPPDRVAVGGFGAPAPPPLVAGGCYVQVVAEAGTAAGLAERLSELEEVSGVAVVAGDFDLLVGIPQTWEMASGTILDQIHQLPGIRSTSTLVSVSYEEPEEDRDQFSAWS